MTSKKIEELLQQGEGIDIEFKTSAFDLNKDIFDSICAFLNRRGGHLLLGVKDNGKVEGIIESCIPEMVNNLIATANNPAKLNPPLYCSPQVLDYEGKKIIYLYVPESAHVHSTNGKVFDRSGDGDIRTNLIDSYDRLMAFIAKHLPDKFYLDSTTSISLRDRLFREVVSKDRCRYFRLACRQTAILGLKMPSE